MSDRETYTARAERSAGWWAITVPELRGVHSQARRLELVPAAARDAIAAMLDVEPDSFDVVVEHVLDDDVRIRLERYGASSVQARASAEAAGRASREAATALLERGYTVRDAGAVLGLSPQRVSQLTRRAQRPA